MICQSANKLTEKVVATSHLSYKGYQRRWETQTVQPKSAINIGIQDFPSLTASSPNILTILEKNITHLIQNALQMIFSTLGIENQGKLQTQIFTLITTEFINMAQQIGNPAATARQISQPGTTPIDGYIEKNKAALKGLGNSASQQESVQASDNTVEDMDQSKGTRKRPPETRTEIDSEESLKGKEEKC